MVLLCVEAHHKKNKIHPHTFMPIPSWCRWSARVTHHSSLSGPEDFPACGTISANSRAVLEKPGWLISLRALVNS